MTNEATKERRMTLGIGPSIALRTTRIRRPKQKQKVYGGE